MPLPGRCPAQRKGRPMTISALEVGRRADALVQIMRSEELLDEARDIMDEVAAEDWPDVARAFTARGWEDDGEPAPDRGVRIEDWLMGVADRL